MGWLDGWFGTSSSQDPLRNLDPKLREVLEKESSTRNHPPQQPVQRPRAPSTERTRHKNNDTEVAVGGAPSGAPAESLFRDGRYAHLWKTYRSQTSVEAETKTASEKLSDMMDEYKERNYNIKRASMENCAVEQEEWVNCMREGKWEDRLQMCRHQVRRYERCVTVQSRLLKALGYGSTPGQGVGQAEDLQMHADTLYHRVLAQEKAVEAAKEAGEPMPTFEPAVPSAVLFQQHQSLQEDKDEVQPSEDMLKGWRRRLEELPEDERSAEEQALWADFRARAQMAAGATRIWEAEAADRRARQAEGKTTWTDAFWGSLRPSDSKHRSTVKEEKS